MSKRIGIVLSLIVLAMATRLIPHWPNFTAIGAVALFGATIFKNRWLAFGLPLVALFLSDLVINNLIYSSFQNGFTWFTGGFAFIYGGFILTALIGRYGVNHRSFKGLTLGTLSSAVVFYLLTNFGVWLSNPMYTQDFSGLMASYAAGLPFLANQAAGTIFYSALLFGAAHYLVPRYQLSPRQS